MRIAFLDCFAGISGDMFLGALLHAGVPRHVLDDAAAALGIGASLEVETVDRSGISCLKVHVLEHGQLAEAKQHTHTHEADHTHARPEVLEQHTHTPEPLTQQINTQHLHKAGQPHTHAHEHPHTHDHTHGRSLTQIRTLIESAPLHDAVKGTAVRAFTLLGHAEAKIHNVPVDDIHFHEVGAVDAIVDIVATCAGIHHLGIGAWYSSPLNVGGGTVQCAHGTFPVPAPATADLLRGVPTYSAHVQKELVTPTGAALLRALDPTFSPQPAMTVESIGYGAGTRNPKDFPNVLRLSIGELDASTPTRSANGEAAEIEAADAKRQTQTVAVLETALDDATPQLLAYVAEQALAHGALDVMLTPVLMKKGRPGTLLTVLADPAHSDALGQLILRETPTLGLRIRHDQRTTLAREHQTVQTPYGPVRIKLGLADGAPQNATPEYEDCKAVALAGNIPLKQVQQAAIAAYLTTRH